MLQSKALYIIGALILVSLLILSYNKIDKSKDNNEPVNQPNNEQVINNNPTNNPRSESELAENAAPNNGTSQAGIQIDKLDSETNNDSRKQEESTTPPPSQETVEQEPPLEEEPETCDHMSSFTGHFLCLLNEYRNSQGLNSLSYNSAMNIAAQGHSDWMDANTTFSHTGANNSNMSDRCIAAGTSCDAENLASGASSPENLLNMWKNSPIHNENLLGSHTLLGFGVAGKYITVVFQ